MGQDFTLYMLYVGNKRCMMLLIIYPLAFKHLCFVPNAMGLREQCWYFTVTCWRNKTAVCFRIPKITQVFISAFLFFIFAWINWNPGSAFICSLERCEPTPLEELPICWELGPEWVKLKFVANPCWADNHRNPKSSPCTAFEIVEDVISIRDMDKSRFLGSDIFHASLLATLWVRFPGSQDVKERADFQNHSHSLTPACHYCTGT